MNQEVKNENPKREESEILHLTGMWMSPKRDKYQNPYYTGSLGKGVKVFLFTNKEKKNNQDGQPNYYLCLKNVRLNESSGRTTDEHNRPKGE